MRRLLWHIFSALLTVHLVLALVQWVTIQQGASYAVITFTTGICYAIYYLGAKFWAPYTDLHGATKTTKYVLLGETTLLIIAGIVLYIWAGAAIAVAIVCSAVIGFLRPGNDAGNFRHVAEWRDRSGLKQLARHLVSLEGLSRTLSAAAIGLLVGAFGAINVLSLVFIIPLTGLLIWRDKSAPLPSPKFEENIDATPWNGVRSIWQQKDVRGSSFSFVAYNSIIAGPFSLILPWLTLESGLSPAKAGIVMTIGGFGGIAASSFIPPLLKRFDYHLTVIISYLVLAAFYLSFAYYLHHQYIAALLAILILTGNQAVISLSVSWRQEHVPTNITARFATTVRSAGMIGGAIGLISAGTIFIALHSNEVLYITICLALFLPIIIYLLLAERSYATEHHLHHSSHVLPSEILPASGDIDDIY